ncbi:MAG: M48 family metalloprotease [Longimicrobiaceae bacterium]
MSRNRLASRIVAILRASWASVWILVIPKDLWGLLCIWPTLFIALASYLWVPSDQGVQLILLAAMWDIVIGFWLTLSAMKKSRDALASMIVQLQDCSYTPIRWSQILRGDDEARIDRSSLINFLGRQGLPYDHHKDVRVFRVDTGDSGVIPGGLGVFNIPFTETVILVRDDPEYADVEDRYYLYHELGHTLGDEFAAQSALHKGAKLPLVALVLAAMVMPFEASSFLVLSLCVVGLSLVGLALSRQRKSFRAISEMKADQFAIGFLKDEEKRYVHQHAASMLPEDRELSAWEHQARIISVRSFIESGVSLTHTHPEMSQRTSIFESQLAALNLGAWMIMLAGFIGMPGAGVLYRFKWLIATAIVLAVLRFAKHYWKGLFLELIFIGRVTWQDGKFQLWTSRRSPAPSPRPRSRR